MLKLFQGYLCLIYCSIYQFPYESYCYLRRVANAPACHWKNIRERKIEQKANQRKNHLHQVRVSEQCALPGEENAQISDMGVPDLFQLRPHRVPQAPDGKQNRDRSTGAVRLDVRTEATRSDWYSVETSSLITSTS